ncbi:DNA-binding protein [Agaribacterium sp. ZY112]|uniref:DNA-binding protein n=1 Tax=Agaribacterium sp. ZY112 TaxID=3233574 RepID=UPI0035234DB8
MARPGVTYYDIQQAAQAIQGQGAAPTIDRVRAHLGTGSKSTIAPLLKRWRLESEVHQDAPGLPPSILTAAKTVFEACQAEANLRIADAEEKMAVKCRQKEADLITEKSRTRRLEDECQSLKERLKEAQKILDDEEAKRKAVTTELEGKTASLIKGQTRLAERENEINELKVERGRMRDHLTHFQQQSAREREREQQSAQAAQRTLQERIAALTEVVRTTEVKLSKIEVLYSTTLSDNNNLNQALLSNSEQTESLQVELNEIARQRDNARTSSTHYQNQYDNASAALAENAENFGRMSAEKGQLGLLVDELKSKNTKLENKIASVLEQNQLLTDDQRVLSTQLEQLKSGT